MHPTPPAVSCIGCGNPLPLARIKHPTQKGWLCASCYSAQYIHNVFWADGGIPLEGMTFRIYERA